jgi:hypothetical protein
MGDGEFVIPAKPAPCRDTGAGVQAIVNPAQAATQAIVIPAQVAIQAIVIPAQAGIQGLALGRRGVGGDA